MMRSHRSRFHEPSKLSSGWRRRTRMQVRWLTRDQIPAQGCATIDVTRCAAAQNGVQVPWMQAVGGTDRTHIFAGEYFAAFYPLDHEQGPAKTQAVCFPLPR